MVIKQLASFFLDEYGIYVNENIRTSFRKQAL